MSDNAKILGSSQQELTSDAQKFYENYWVEDAGRSQEAQGRHRQLRDLFLPVLPTGKQILEIGVGGEGGMIRELMHTNQVLGLDASQQAVDVCRRGGLEVMLFEADRHRLPFDEDRFDIVFACEVFEHFSNPQFALEEIQRVLKPQGLLGITTPHPCVQHWPRLFYPSLFEQSAFREFLMVNKFRVSHEMNFGEHPFRALDDPKSVAWSWIWCAQNIKRGSPKALFGNAQVFWDSRNSRGIRRGAIEAAELFRTAFREDPSLVEADYAHTLALTYRVLNGERKEFQDGIERMTAILQDSLASKKDKALAAEYYNLANNELRLLGLLRP